LTIAVALFCLGHTLKVITIPMMKPDLRIIRGLALTAILNLLSLR
jgi:hypothetical protein